MNFFKIILIAISAILLRENLLAQSIEAVYEAQIHTVNGASRSGKANLQFTDTSAVFYYPDWSTLERTVHFPDGSTGYFHGDPDNFRTYSNLVKNEVHHTSDYLSPGGYNFVFVDSMAKIDWTISNQTKKAGERILKQATGKFGGRDYEAWFAPSIPCNFGPNRFCGLPGLIFQISSLDNLVHYKLTSLRNNSGIDNIRPPIGNKYMTPGEFEKYAIKDLLFVESLSDESGTSTNAIPTPNHDIIKNRWTVIKDYKENRGW